MTAPREPRDRRTSEPEPVGTIATRAIETIAERADVLRMLARDIILRRDGAEAKAAQLARAQQRAGHAIDTRTSYAEGARDAYHVIAAVVAGVAGLPTIDAVAGDDWERGDNIAPPVLPDGADTLYGGGGVVRGAVWDGSERRIGQRRSKALWSFDPTWIDRRISDRRS